MTDMKEIPTGRSNVDSLGQTLKGVGKAEFPQTRDTDNAELSREQRQEILEKQMAGFDGTNPVQVL